MRIKKVLALLLTLCLGLGALAGCGTQTGGTNNEPTYVYNATYTPFEIEGMSYVMNSAVTEDSIYLAVELEEKVPYVPEEADDQGGDAVVLPAMQREKVMVEVETGTDIIVDEEIPEYIYNYRTALYRMELDGSDLKEIESYEPIAVPDGLNGNSSIMGIYTRQEGGFMLLSQVYWFNEDYTEYGTDYYIQRYDAEDNLIDTIKLENFLGQDEYVNNVILDKNGNLVVNTTTANFVLDSATGEELFKVERSNDYAEMVLLGDGNIGSIVYTYDDVAEKQVITMKTLDMETKTWGETEYTIDVYTNQLFPGDSLYDFYYTNSNVLFGYDVETAVSTEVINFIEAGVDWNYMNRMLIEDGRIIGVESRWDNDTGKQLTSLVNMELVDASTLPARKVLTIGVAYEDYELNEFIIDFNRTNTEYKLSLKNYGAYNTISDNTAGMTKLSTEVIAGNGPDILETSWLPLEQYAAKGLLVDLTPYIDNDPEIGPQGIVEPLRKAMEIDGKLYETVTRFSVETAFGLEKVVGSELGWTYADMMAAKQMLQEGAYILSDTETRDLIMGQMVYYNLNQFVDWQKGECYFDSQDFINILKFCKDFPTEINWDEYEYQSYQTLLAEGRQLLSSVYVSNFFSIATQKASISEPLTIVGYPSEEGYGATFVTGYQNYAITENCDDPDGAWSVLRHFMTEEYQQDEYQFPANAAAFEKKMQEAMTVTYHTDENGEFVLDETGEKIPQVKEWAWNEATGESIEITHATEEDIALVMQILNSTTRVNTQDESLAEIIDDSAGAFFAGQRTAEDTAALIQSRVKIYVNE